MLSRLLAPLAVSLALLASCSASAAPSPTERVTRVVIKKGDHSLSLLSGDKLVKSYGVALGPGGAGPKLREGDKVTPVGRYHVTAHQPSQYKVFLRLDYPNAEDHKRFAALKRSGQLPADATIGGDIGIHGPPVRLAGPVKASLKAFDWTLGCIALDEDEIDEVSRLVKDGTVVDIED